MEHKRFVWLIPAVLVTAVACDRGGSGEPSPGVEPTPATQQQGLDQRQPSTLDPLGQPQAGDPEFEAQGPPADPGLPPTQAGPMGNSAHGQAPAGNQDIGGPAGQQDMGAAGQQGAGAAAGQGAAGQQDMAGQGAAGQQDMAGQGAAGQQGAGAAAQPNDAAGAGAEDTPSIGGGATAQQPNDAAADIGD